MLNFVGLYLTQPCFSHGQLYVGLSKFGKPIFLAINSHLRWRTGKLNALLLSTNSQIPDLWLCEMFPFKPLIYAYL